jgi:hypothetical protein
MIQTIPGIKYNSGIAARISKLIPAEKMIENGKGKSRFSPDALL